MSEVRKPQIHSNKKQQRSAFPTILVAIKCNIQAVNTATQHVAIYRQTCVRNDSAISQIMSL